jgi:glycosidase
MQWGPDGGFTTAEEPWHAYYEDYQERHVAGQSDDPNSLLNHYNTLIHLRNTHTALRVGSWLPVEAGHQSVYAYLRVDGAEVILVLVNLGNDPVDEYSLTLQAGPLASGLQPKLLMGAGEIDAPQVNESSGFTHYQPIATLPPRSSFIIQFTP